MRALPDGYTLFIGNVTTNAISETLYPKVFDKLRPSRDLVGVTNLVEIPHVLLAHPSVPGADAKEFAAHARKIPGKLNYASSGIGSYPHLDMIMFQRAAGIEMTHIPYKGGAGQMVPALLGNESQVTFLNIAVTIEHIRAGRLKALAMTTPQRLPELPGVPTMAELGFPGIGTNAWNGLFAPAAIPRPLLGRLHAETVKIMNSPEVRDLFGKILMQVATSKSPEDYSAFVRAETAKWAKVIKDNNIRIDI
jgi:tripartite-type tricarboxylate transporter receptor subunit TctC